MSIIYCKEKDGTLNVAVAGKVSREPELKSTSKGDTIKFSVSYGKSKYMDCDTWADSDAGRIAGMLEKGDPVYVMGTHRAWEYNGKSYQSVTADLILTGAVPAPPAAQSAAPAPSAPAMEEITEDDAELPF